MPKQCKRHVVVAGKQWEEPELLCQNRADWWVNSHTANIWGSATLTRDPMCPACPWGEPRQWRERLGTEPSSVTVPWGQEMRRAVRLLSEGMNTTRDSVFVAVVVFLFAYLCAPQDNSAKPFSVPGAKSPYHLLQSYEELLPCEKLSTFRSNPFLPCFWSGA